MLFSQFLTPLKTEADFVSNFFTKKVSASGIGVHDGNSQNMELLQANTPSPLFTKDSGEIREDIIVNIVSDNALSAATTLLSSTEESVGGGDFFGEPSIYVVKSGDTVSIIAELFGVTSDTILSANNMKKGDKLKEGEALLILSFSGVEHSVNKGETLGGIANKYKVDIDDILIANDIESDAKIVVGDKLMIPGGQLLAPEKPKSTGTSLVRSSSSSVPVTAGYFKNPLPGWPRTRGITKSHRGVDLAAPTGTPIHAAADGTVVIARTGNNGGFGNYVVIQHSNGTKTLYAHMSRLGITAGANVSQGEVIGYVGNTGRSRGAHLHIEVLNGKNPF